MKNKHWFNWKRALLVLGVISAIFGIPLIINSLYLNGQNLEQPNTVFTGSDILSYCGEILVFIGTSLLAYMAYRQTETQNTRERDNEQANTMCPFFVIESVTSGRGKTLRTAKFEKCHYVLEDPKSVKIHLKNIGAGVATNLTYSTKPKFGRRPAVVVDPDDYISQSVTVDDIYDFPIVIPSKWDCEEPTHYKTIEYENILGYKYSQTFSYKIALGSKGEEYNEEQFNVLYVYNISSQKRIGFSDTSR